MARQTTFEGMKKALAHIVGDIRILSGDIVGPSDSTWQDVAGTLSVNLRALASMVDEWRAGNAKPFCCFPGFDDAGEHVLDEDLYF